MKNSAYVNNTNKDIVNENPLCLPSPCRMDSFYLLNNWEKPIEHS